MSEEQYMEALALANEIRLANVTTRRAIGQMTKAEAARACADLIENPDDVEGRMRLDEALRAMPHWGRVRVHKLCVRLALPERCRLAKLTARQRKLLAAYLREGEAAIHSERNGFIR